MSVSGIGSADHVHRNEPNTNIQSIDQKIRELKDQINKVKENKKLSPEEKEKRIKNLEQQLVTLFTIFAHECGEILHSGCFDGPETIEGIHLTDGIEDIIAFGHFHGTEVAGAFGNSWFLRHNIIKVFVSSVGKVTLFLPHKHHPDKSF